MPRKRKILEKNMEAAIISHNLEQFLSELRNDFCFMARQYSLQIDDVDNFLDLLFYHRELGIPACWVVLSCRSSKSEAGS
jgi:predicted nuclease of restriction endonuclease-like (RecB) superfamily